MLSNPGDLLLEMDLTWTCLYVKMFSYLDVPLFGWVEFLEVNQAKQ